LIDLVYRRGHLRFSDSQTTALYFSWFAISLAFWAAQGLYARAFYAAGNTITPMVASSIITAASLPVYAALFRGFSTVGLVAASDLGIMVNCLAMALLLHWRCLVSAAGLNWNEIGKALLIAIVAGVVSTKIGSFVSLHGSRLSDLKSLCLTAATWAAVVAIGLWLLRSNLPRELRRRPQASQSLTATE
jgi:putative peptidoglycan lipid II flippase